METKNTVKSFENIPKLSKDTKKLLKIVSIKNRFEINKALKIKHYKEYKFFMKQEQDLIEDLFKEIGTSEKK